MTSTYSTIYRDKTQQLKTLTRGIAQETRDTARLLNLNDMPHLDYDLTSTLRRKPIFKDLTVLNVILLYSPEAEWEVLSRSDLPRLSVLFIFTWSVLFMRRTASGDPISVFSLLIQQSTVKHTNVLHSLSKNIEHITIYSAM